MAELKARGWACIVYPESAPPDWVDKLKESHLEILISPLHDADVDAEGKPKKEHYHVLAIWPGPTVESAARKLFSSIGITAPPEVVRTLKGYARYLCHLDDHDKAPYDPANVIALGGAVWAAVALDEAEERDRILDEIEAYIDSSGVVSYAMLMRFARSCRPEWKAVIRRSSIHLSALLRSAEWDAKREMPEGMMALENGELVQAGQGAIPGGGDSPEAEPAGNTTGTP